MKSLFSTLSLVLMAVVFAACDNGGKVEEKIPVTGVKLNETGISIVQGTTGTLVATVYPENATNKKVKWDSNPKAVATVDDTGVITALTPGKTTIMVTTADGGYSATCAVTVEQEGTVLVTGVELDGQTLTLQEGKTATLTATVEPENATDKTIAWESDNKEVATVEEGVVTALKEGTATISVKSTDGSNKSASCALTVVPHPTVTGVTLDITEARLDLNETLVLTATVSPEEAPNKKVSWTSNNKDVAFVNDGTVTALSSGTATITVTTEENQETATCEITVNSFLGEVSFKSEQTWQPEAGKRTWSDVVMATGCKKDTFYGGDYMPFNADCRQNPGYGDLFSWAALEQYGDELCPGDWHVPTKDDYYALDRGLSGTGENAQSSTVQLNKYIDRWGLTFGGLSGPTGELSKQESDAMYWMSTRQGSDKAYFLQVTSAGVIYPAMYQDPIYGMQLRCVHL